LCSSPNYEDAVGRICSTHLRDSKCIHNFDGIPEGKGNLGEFDIDGMIILKCVLEGNGM
jgi:hypothetical protein